jgi:hypothetical protein
LAISGGELTAAARAAAALRKALKRPEPVDVLKYRKAVRDEIRTNLDGAHAGVPEIIVVRLSKKDVFPSTDSLFYGLFRSSPWFKFEFKRLHDRGLEVYVSIETVTIRKGKARRAEYGDADERGGDRRKVWVVGRIPYERIAYVDWDPDPVYSSPRFYVSYGWGGPFREVVLFEQWAHGPRGRQPGQRPDADLFEIHDVEYQGESGNPWRWTKYTVDRLRFSIEQRREEKRSRKELSS